jgi:cytochrome b561
LLALVSLHVLAALKHQLVDRDGLLSRMLPFAK